MATGKVVMTAPAITCPQKSEEEVVPGLDKDKECCRNYTWDGNRQNDAKERAGPGAAIDQGRFV